MSNKINRQLEKQMMQALQRVKDFSRQQEEKVDKRNWGPIDVPVGLQEALSTYTKIELDSIRKKLEIKGASSLKKDQLITVLQESIPQHLESVCLTWDSERFDLVASVASSGGYVKAPYLDSFQISYLRDSGLVVTGSLHGERILAVPEELIKPILSLRNNIEVRAKIKRNTEWVRLTYGLLHYYGTLRADQMFDMLEKYMNEKLDLREYLNVIHDAKAYSKEIKIDETGFSNRRVFDPKQVIKEHEMRKGVPFYPFSKEQLLTAGEPGYIEITKSFQQVVSFLTKQFEISKEDAVLYVSECVFAARSGASLNSVIQYLANLIKIDSEDTFQALTNHIIYLMNNTKQWYLKGHTSMELKEQKPSNQQTNQLSNPSSTTEEKIGRNDPCPCGSGKKYKKCCG
ncbi:SEC-C metal-binding domain-containing protein [Bacillus pinisoli]|uniref:SEC-C metal-binding domain-containing protein n=1 Tax=Bacillus pinisoli TaxID=2901866 RepID=UPI001FF41574|nr:SEC-C metal-binding domain-containing protein [Bacillus pinisoli]